MARALAAEPQLLLLDEPFSALDPLLRGRVRQELRAILEKSGVPALVITHDPADVEVFADQLALYEHGRISRVMPFRGTFGTRSASSALKNCWTQPITHMKMYVQKDVRSRRLPDVSGNGKNN